MVSAFAFLVEEQSMIFSNGREIDDKPSTLTLRLNPPALIFFIYCFYMANTQGGMLCNHCILNRHFNCKTSGENLRVLYSTN